MGWEKRGELEINLSLSKTDARTLRKAGGQLQSLPERV